MDIWLRFWNQESNRIEDQYWDSKFLGDTIHQHFQDSVHEVLKAFDMTKMVQLLMDGPNVNLKLLKNLKEQRNELGTRRLISVARCNLHIIHGSFKSGAEANEWI